MSKTLKRVIIALVSIAVVVGAAFAAVKIIRNVNRKPVNVYSARDFMITDYWGDTSETYGMVTTDKIQKVYESDNQTITEIFVNEGDEIHKGDLLLAYDTTLTDIDLEKAQINVRRLEMELENAQKELSYLNGLTPHYSKLIIPDTSWIRFDPQVTPMIVSGNGTQSDPIYVLYGEGDEINDVLIDSLFKRAEDAQGIKAPVAPVQPPEETTTETEPASTEPESTQAESTSEPESGETESTVPETTEPETEEPTTEPEDWHLKEVYAAFVTREHNALNAMITRSLGLRINRSGGSISFSIYEPVLSSDITRYDEVPEPYYEEYGSDYTSEEISQMISDKKEEIAVLVDELNVARVDLEGRQALADEGRVYAKIDGTIKAVRDPAEAAAANEAVVELSAAGGYYINVAMSELELDSMEVGQTVTVNSWETGEMCEGSVVEIMDYPTTDANSWSNGNTNVSYYPFVVFVNEDANLREGTYVNVTYEKPNANPDSVYLENMFIRSENGKSYIFTEGENGLLEKRFVRTGKGLWGSYTEVISGLSTEDHIAFPYGKDVVEGAKTNEAPSDEFYKQAY